MKGHITKRGSSWCFVVDTGRDPMTGKRRRKWVSGFRTKKEAEKACAEFIASMDSFVSSQKQIEKDQTFAAFAEFVMSSQERNLKETTYQNQMFLLRKHIIPAIGHLRLREITPIVLERFYSEMLKKNLSSAYVRSMSAIIGKIFANAHKWELIDRNPATVVSRPRVGRKEMRVWTLDQSEQFLRSTVDRRWYIVYAIALRTGMRRGEILALKWSDIDFESSVIHVQRTLSFTKSRYVFSEPKTAGSNRMIPIPETLINELRRHRKRQQEARLKLGAAFQDHDLVVTTWKGTPVYPSDIDRDFVQVIKETGLPRIRFHDLRHTHATILLRLGEHPKVVAERLGHSSVTVTLDTYSHVLPDMQRGLVDRLEEAIRATKRR